MGGESNPFPEGLPSKNSGIWGSSSNRNWTPGRKLISCPQEPVPQRSPHRKGASCHGSSSPTVRWTEVCYSHSPEIHVQGRSTSCQPPSRSTALASSLQTHLNSL